MNILMVLIPISPRGISAGVRISSAAVPSAAARTSPARCQTPQFSRPSRAAAPEHHDPPGGPKEPDGNHKGIIAVNHRGFIFGFIFGYIYMWINIHIYIYMDLHVGLYMDTNGFVADWSFYDIATVIFSQLSRD